MKKKKMMIVAAATLAATLAVGGTLALLNKTTQTVTNVFASSRSLSDNIQLREPAWDGYDFGEYVTGTTDPTGNKVKDPDNSALGYNEANNYKPGDTIAKDPTVKNILSDGDTAYVALKVEFIDNSGTAMTYDDFKTAYLKATGITFNTAWTNVTPSSTSDKSSYFVYGTAAAATELAANTATAPLFTKVPLGLQLKEGTDGKLPTFKIKITAYAIQANNVGADDAVGYLTTYATTGNMPTSFN